MPPETLEEKIATVWFLAARAMSVADGNPETARQAAGGLYAQAILGISEQACLTIKSSGLLDEMTLLDCLGMLREPPRDHGERIMTGVMMIAYANRSMHPLEVRWASTLASALEFSEDDFQRMCVNARVMSSMLDAQSKDEASDGSIDRDPEAIA